MSGESVIDLSHGVELVLNLLLVEGIEEDLNVLLAVKGDSGRSASDGGWVYLFNIIKLYYLYNTISSRVAA